MLNREQKYKIANEIIEEKKIDRKKIETCKLIIHTYERSSAVGVDEIQIKLKCGTILNFEHGVVYDTVWV